MIEQVTAYKTSDDCCFLLFCDAKDHENRLLKLKIKKLLKDVIQDQTNLKRIQRTSYWHNLIDNQRFTNRVNDSLNNFQRYIAENKITIKLLTYQLHILSAKFYN